MNIRRLYQILGETTMQLRKGAEVEETKVNGMAVTEIFAMPHQSEARDIAKVDVHFLVVGVDKALAEAHKTELIEILRDYPSPEHLVAGSSYIEVGAVIGDQGAAFQLFALGKVLGLWDIITPESLGFSGDKAREMAGGGYILISGLRGVS